MRLRLIRQALLVSACSLFAGLTAAGALAALPRTYSVQRVDSPNPTAGGDFGIGFVNTGDVNGDGKDDILVGTDEHGGGPGVVYVMSGATGSLIRSIAAPEGCYPSCGAGTGTPASFGSYVGKLADIGSCVGGSGPASTCTSIGAPDGVPDELVTALGVDVGFDCTGNTGVLIDAGLAYVVDGATGAILKRLQMPDCDLYEQSLIPAKPAFGRTILNPSSQYGPTAGDLTGPTTPPLAVRIGDLDGGGRPDIVVSASDYYETGATANPASDCATFGATPASNQCLQAGRSYVFYGESVLATVGDVDKTPDLTIKNLAAQHDDPTTPVNSNRENLGYSIAPVGDIGRCTTNPGPGAVCTNANSVGTPDGKPDLAISSHRTDDFGMFDAGVVLLIDGSTGSVLYTYRHPEPQPASLFGFTNYNQPAVGDLGSSTAVDVYEPAMRENNPYTGGGKGYVMNGAFKQSGSPNSISFATLNDPTPHASEDFGTSSAGIGNVFGDGRTEVMIGAYGPHNPGTNQNAINDVHIFSALDESELQRFDAPDQQPGLGFGTALAPMGDLNGDGFVDYAVGAGLWDGPAGADQGRIYIFRSDNSPAPPPPPGPPPPSPPPPPTVLAGRSLELAVSRTTIRRGQGVLLRGLLEAFANQSSCQSRQPVKIQRRLPGRVVYGTVRTVTTARSGAFSLRLKPRATFVYRARVDQTTSCLGAVSDRRLVKVRRKR
jgi:hypothetical protein